MEGKYVPHDKVPKSWEGRCSGNGHKDSFNKGIRPCLVCGEFPDKETGDDACMVSLGSVVNACCGHGTNEGYIMFDDNRVVYGLFTIENIRDNNEELTAKEIYKARIDESKRKLDFYEKQVTKYKKLYHSYKKGEYIFK